MGPQATHQKEMAQKNAKIQSLQDSTRSLSAERDSLFDQLQLRQAELESSQSRLESVESSMSELQFQLREAQERSGLLAEELSDARRELEYRSIQPSVNHEVAQRSTADLEARYEERYDELKRRLSEVELERNETEAALNRSLQSKAQEIDSLKKLVDRSTVTKDRSEDEVASLRQAVEELKQQANLYESQLADLKVAEGKVRDLEVSTHFVFS